MIAFCLYLFIFVDQVARKFDELLRESHHYWPLDGGKEGIKNMKRTNWINHKQLETVERGLHDKAVETRPVDGPVHLTNSKPFSDLYNSSKGLTIAMWLYYQSNNQGQTFLTIGINHGLVFYQPNSSFEHVAFSLTQLSTQCTWVFHSTQNVWSHYVFSWPSWPHCSLDPVTYLNGQAVGKVAKETLTDVYPSILRTVALGDLAGSKLPKAMFDDILLWGRDLQQQEVEMFYQYYKGKHFAGL